MFARATIVEENKLLRRWLLWILVAMLGGVTFLTVVLGYFDISGMIRSAGGTLPPEAQGYLDRITWPGAVANAFDGNLIVMSAMMMIVLVGAVMAQEYDWRTLQLWLSRGLPRPVLFGAKIGALLVPVLLLALAPFVAAIVPSGVVTSLLAEHLADAEPLAAGQIALSILRTAYVLLFYVALTVTLAVVTRSVVFAIGGGIVFDLLFNNLVFNLLANAGRGWLKLATFFPRGLTIPIVEQNRVTAAPLADPGLGSEFFAPGPAALLLGAYIVVLLGVSLAVFMRQDLSG